MTATPAPSMPVVWGPDLLAGKIAIVTGGGQGIGEGIARALAAAGARVIVAGRRLQPLERVAAEIGGTAVACDIASEADIKSLMAACDDAYGRLDVLVNNAGIAGARKFVHEMDMAACDEAFAINIRGSFLCIKYAVPLMLRRNAGSIINVSSSLVQRGRSDYIATKYGKIGLTQAAAVEFGPLGIRANTLWPGSVDTPMIRKTLATRAVLEKRDIDELVATDYIKRTSLKRWVEASEVGQAAVFLASDASSAITGETLRVDCGKL